MISAKCFFRGNFLNEAGATRLLQNLCTAPEFTPDYWGIYEPVNHPFKKDNLKEVIYGSMVPCEKARKHFVRTLAFFVRKRKPSMSVAIDLSIAPVQLTTAHNRLMIDEVKETWKGGEEKLAYYLSRSILPNYPDYAKVVDSSQEDPNRLNEFRRPLTAQEVLQQMAEEQKKPPVAPFGPYGCIEDIYWFNYFGRVYVDFIGKSRLTAAGWARVEEIGDGLACYATETLKDPRLQERRIQIASALEEFVWSPGCKAEDKKVPFFDYSEQYAALPPETVEKLRHLLYPGVVDHRVLTTEQEEKKIPRNEGI